MTEAVRWTCPTCDKEVSTPFCATCGEEPLAPRDLSLRAVSAKFFHALTSIDARVARTAWCLLRAPGRLTLSWAAGVRRPYVAPFQLFLIANVLFFALQSLTGTNVFSSPLESHLHHQDWSAFAQERVAQRLAQANTTLDRLAPLFDRSVVLHAKSLIVLMTLPFALLLPLAFLGARRPFMVHVAFSLHLYTFLLLLFSGALLVATASAALGLGGIDAPRVDNVLSVVNLAACALYLHVAIGVVYGERGAARALKAAALTICVAAIVLGYRFAMFVLTLYSV
jgi:hypothetical protein